MTFTYGNDPANSNRDAVRVLLNDVTESTALLTDETVAWLLSAHPNVWYAAAAGADMLAAQNASSVSEKQVGDLKVKYGAGDIAAQWSSRAAELRRLGAVKGFKAYSGGISIADKDSQESDSDWDRPGVSLGMHSATESQSTSGRWDF